ncbi:MAG: M23 family metallopeptidase [Eubacteriales bacterium]
MYKQWRPKPRTRRKSLKKQSLNQRVSLCLGCFLLFSLTFQPFFPEISRLSLNHQGLQSAFQTLGTTLAAQEFSLEKIETFCHEVFGVSPEEEAVMVFLPLEEEFKEETKVLESPSFFQEIEEKALPFLSDPLPYPESGQVVIAQQTLPEEEPMVIGTVLSSATEEEEEEGYTFDLIYLGEEENFPPVYAVVTSPFGTRLHPLTNIYTLHRGVDLRATTGTEVHAWRSGKVIDLGENQDLGIYVRLDHGDNIQSLYAHCSQAMVSMGDSVEGNTIIALSGDTGSVTAPHLHFEILWNGVNLNPLHYFDYESILP